MVSAGGEDEMPATLEVSMEDLTAGDLSEALLATLRASGFDYAQLQAFALNDEFPSVRAKATWLAVRDLK
jgi:hypothetical protein